MASIDVASPSRVGDLVWKISVSIAGSWDKRAVLVDATTVRARLVVPEVLPTRYNTQQDTQNVSRAVPARVPAVGAVGGCLYTLGSYRSSQRTYCARFRKKRIPIYIVIVVLAPLTGGSLFHSLQNNAAPAVGGRPNASSCSRRDSLALPNPS